MLTAVIIDSYLDLAHHIEPELNNLQITVYKTPSLAEYQALQLTEHPDIAFISSELPEGDAYEQLKLLPDFLDNCEVILVSDQPNYREAAQAIRIGIQGYLACPPIENELQKILNDLLDSSGSDIDSDDINMPIERFGQLYGNSACMRKIYRQIRKAAPSDLSIFIYGESGCGKELAAETIHQRSTVKDEVFEAINCGAIPAELMESELFGHMKGSFTGAHKNYVGCFERANGGTLFLDEIGEMPIDLQPKLLRVLETGEIRPVGSETSKKINIRVLAATNRAPDEAVQEGILREDLYYRLAQFPMRLPPLRERKDDAIALAQLFLRQLNKKYSDTKTFSSAALEYISLNEWPGNVRELKHGIERAYILSDDDITPADFPITLQLTDSSASGEYLRIPVGIKLSQAERKIILATVENCEGDKKAAADILGMSLKTLYNKINSYKKIAA